MFQETLVPRGMDGFIRMMEQRVVIHHSVRLVRAMLSDIFGFGCPSLGCKLDSSFSFRRCDRRGTMVQAEDGYSVDETHHSVPLVRVMAFDVEHITCGTFPSLSEGVGLPAAAFIDSVVHATCDACHSMLTTPVGACWSCRALGYDICHSLPHRLSGFIRGVMREGCDVCSHLHAAEVALRCI